MPTSSNTSSPVKRPGLGRRAVSSHAVVTRSSSSTGELSLSHSSQTQKAPHRPLRPHLVGGGHRTHGRNPSFGKNLNKLQRHLSSQHIGPEVSARLHQRKKSAPVTPAASPPKGSHHVRWDGAVDGHHRTAASMKRNNSTPALRRNTSGVITKKALVTDRPQSSSGKKKSVGFELADSSDNDDGDWEDTTQSPESTRRGSVAQSKDSVENPVVLVDPLTFVKRTYPQFPRATSLPESTSRSFHEDQSSGEDDNQGSQHEENTEDQQEDPEPVTDHVDIAARLLSPSHSAKAPPAMSSISATATPAPVGTISRNTSLTNLAGHDALRRPLSSANMTQSSTPAGHTHATSSSIEGGVSRFIVNNKIGTSHTNSDPNTPSSFLPHYHPQTPPSPRGGTSSKKTRASPPSRPPGTEPPSRTQQKLWLQRTAALNTSPPDSHGTSTSVSPAAMDPTYIATSRPGPGPFDGARGLVNGTSRVGGVLHQNETKHVRKVYEKTSLELTVVRRFQSPTGESFKRLNAILQGAKLSTSAHERNASLPFSVRSAPALVLQGGRQVSDNDNNGSPDYQQTMTRRQPDIHTSVSQTDLQDPENLVNDPIDSSQQHKSHPSHRLLSTSEETAPGCNPSAEEEPDDSFFANQNELMIRRMWESREVASSS